MRVSRFACVLALGIVGGCTSRQVVTTPVPEPVSGAVIRYATRADTARFVAARLVSLDADQIVFERFMRGRQDRWIVDSIPVASLHLVQVRLARRNKIGAGVLIGTGAGLALGAACAANSDDSWLAPSASECITMGALGGAMWGLIIGAANHRETWAPLALPADAGTPESTASAGP
jgi:hypothetical protein